MGWLELTRRLLIAICLACLVLPASARAGRLDAKAEKLTGKLTADLDGVLAQARSDLVELAELPGIEAGDPEACSAELASRSAAPRYTALGAADLDGDIYCLSTGLTAPVSITDRAYFLRAIGTRDLGVGDFQIGRVTGIGALGLGFPVTSGPDDTLTGITLAPLATAWLTDRVARRHSPKAADSLVIDEHGTVLARAGEVPTAAGTNIGAKRLVQAMLSEDQEGVGGFSLGGERVRTAYDVVPLSGGAVHTAVSIPAG